MAGHRIACAAAAAFVAVAGVTSTAAAQTAPAPASAYTPSRTADGQPDIQGVWEHRSSFAGSIECEYDINGTTGAHENFTPPTDDRPQAPRQRREGPCGKDTSRFGNVAIGLKIPLQPWARQRKDEMFNRIYAVGSVIESPYDLDPVARCLPNGLPRTHGLVGLNQFLQPPGYVVILDEQSHQHRIIPLDARPPLGDDIRLWLGDSRGRWEGNTLIVESKNFNDKTWWDMAATSHSEAQRTMERFTVVDAETIKYEITFEDPKVLSQPFTGLTLNFKRARPGDEILEEECLEGNRLENYGFK
jgi:hypothetical protein